MTPHIEKGQPVVGLQEQFQMVHWSTPPVNLGVSTLRPPLSFSQLEPTPSPAEHSVSLLSNVQIDSIRLVTGDLFTKVCEKGTQ